MSQRPIEIKTTQRAIEPFWSRLPFLFRAPLQPAPLIFLGCLVVASALAGLVLGPFGLVFRGMLIYLGLRYGFNLLDLYRKGRFEGESPDHSLWGPEVRPAKLGLVIAIYVLIGAMLGNWAVASRVTSNPAAQKLVLETYKAEHAADLKAMKVERDEQRDQLQQAAREVAVASAEERAAEEADRAWLARERTERRAEIAAELEALEQAETASGEYGRAREDILREFRAESGSALWFKLLPAWWWIAMLALSLMLPASTLVIAIDDEFFRALDPTWVPHFMRAMGSAYFVLWLFFLLIVGSRQMVLSAGADWPAFLRLPLEMGLGGYLGLVLCALLGYVIYQFHQELHLDVDVDFDTHRQAGGAAAIARAGSARAAVQQADPKTPLERHVQQLVAQGKLAEAIAEVKDEMRYDRLDPELNTLLHTLYLRGSDSAATLAHGQLWLKALVRAGQVREAGKGLRRLLTIDSNFVVEDAAARAALAQLAQAQGDHALIATLSREPGH